MASPFLHFWKIPYFTENRNRVFRDNFYERAVSLQYLYNKLYHHAGGCQARGSESGVGNRDICASSRYFEAVLSADRGLGKRGESVLSRLILTIDHE